MVAKVSVAQIQIRPATERDVSLVLVFIKELAQYEQMGDQVTATEEAVRTALFGPTPTAEAVLAVLGDTPVGFALFFRNFSTFLAKPGLYLEDLYVRPQFRATGGRSGGFVGRCATGMELESLGWNWRGSHQCCLGNRRLAALH